ncbi:hypothetical protein HK098_005539 [Nowakowskiella sp. JEL0407]|nr:hypothetical protein HK098_005539 [Nowakowskiella sp. JEL0407]
MPAPANTLQEPEPGGRSTTNINSQWQNNNNTNTNNTPRYNSRNNNNRKHYQNYPQYQPYYQYPPHHFPYPYHPPPTQYYPPPPVDSTYIQHSQYNIIPHVNGHYPPPTATPNTTGLVLPHENLGQVSDGGGIGYAREDGYFESVEGFEDVYQGEYFEEGGVYEFVPKENFDYGEGNDGENGEVHGGEGGLQHEVEGNGVQDLQVDNGVAEDAESGDEVEMSHPMLDKSDPLLGLSFGEVSRDEIAKVFLPDYVLEYRIGRRISLPKGSSTDVAVAKEVGNVKKTEKGEKKKDVCAEVVINIIEAEAVGVEKIVEKTEKEDVKKPDDVVLTNGEVKVEIVDKFQVTSADQPQNVGSKSEQSSPTSAKPPVAPTTTATFSWAEKVKSGPNYVPPKQVVTTGNNVQRRKSNGKKESGMKFAEFLSTYEPNLKGSTLKPRGLINNGNLCFMNAILQPLVHCSPIMFLNEFPPSSDTTQSEPFAPEYVYDALSKLRKMELHHRGRQEDAEEFLGFLLDAMHEELLSVMGKNTTKPTNEENNEWREVGKKNKVSITRTTEFVDSPISKIFSGRMRSVLRCQGSKDSVKIDAFQTLQLDIMSDEITTIEQALKKITAIETLDEFISPSRGVKVEATKQNFIEELPPILLLHLKPFEYDSKSQTTRKVHKHIKYDTTLRIDPEIISPSARTVVGTRVEYTLFAVVYHHGKSALGGHYTCDVATRDGMWMHCDDESVREGTLMDEGKGKKDWQPYMLFYRRK